MNKFNWFGLFGKKQPLFNSFQGLIGEGYYMTRGGNPTYIARYKTANGGWFGCDEHFEWVDLEGNAYHNSGKLLAIRVMDETTGAKEYKKVKDDHSLDVIGTISLPSTKEKETIKRTDGEIEAIFKANKSLALVGDAFAELEQLRNAQKDAEFAIKALSKKIRALESAKTKKGKG